MEMSERLTLSNFDRTSWALRMIGAAHLVILTSWYLSDRHLISSTGIFESSLPNLPSLVSISVPLLWAIGSLALVSARWVTPALIMSLVGLYLMVGQLPEELIGTNDRALFALTVFATILTLFKSSNRAVTHNLVVSAMTALWGWTALPHILEQSAPIWRDYNALKYWGWTTAAPTELTSTFAYCPEWLLSFACMTLIASMAWGPLACLLKIRLWPVVWFIITPLAFFIGEGMASPLGTLFWVIAAMSLDQRWPNGFDQKLANKLPLHYLSDKGLIRWPVLFLSAWLCLSDHLGITPLIIVACYLLWSPPSDQIDLSLRSIISPMTLTFALAVIILSMRSFGFKEDVQHSAPSFSPWLISSQDGQWTKLPTSRVSLVLELSDDGGSSWQREPHHALDRLSLTHLPWRPFHPLREERWFYQLAQEHECMEGPFMELLQQRLHAHIKRLNTPPLITSDQKILLRVRRVSWVRSLHRFWREEGKGFYCIPTNLPVLLKARAMVRQARKELPRMPKFAPDPRIKRKTTKGTSNLND
jgi:hypothetical protein